jgi:hypothetical protein
VPRGWCQGLGKRGAKKPRTPAMTVALALSWLTMKRASTPRAKRAIGSPRKAQAECAVMPSQNALNFSTRFSGALPAMSAALIAPIEMPATQLGSIPAAPSAS